MKPSKPRTQRTWIQCLPLLGPLLIALLLIGLTLISVSHSSDEDDAESAGTPEIRLVLQITVDGLRADLLNRYRSSFGNDGFERLMGGGAVFENANYQHANTETIVGHTTLATGATPAVHGMIGNAWFDRRSGELGYNIEDADHPLLPSRDDITKGVQVDPAQMAARSNGRSPRKILVPTLGDALSAFHSGKAKIFGVSGKDRSAVAMAGHTGKAFWFSTDSTDFVTSSYYYDEYPAWAAAWNGERKAAKLAGTQWELSSEPSTYRLFDQDDRPYEADLRGYGRTFPHPFGKADDPLFPTRLLVSPYGDELLADFTMELIESEGIGDDEVPDFLSVSFSSVDAVNHFFGPSSLENEETVRCLDRTLARLFAFVDKHVGLDHTLIVLSADHGMADMPEYMESLGYQVGRLSPDEIVAAANGAGESLGIDEIVKLFYRPYVYLDDEKISAAGADRDTAERYVAEAIGAIRGVALAAPTHDLDALGSDPAVKMVRNNHNPERSGDIYVAQRPYWFLFDKGPVACMHGSPWRYDTHVPLMFSGPGITPARDLRSVHPVDIVPTIASQLGITPPAGARGDILDISPANNRERTRGTSSPSQ
ncbi:MAG: alkaline phosphatase family protein [Verrucomicrobiales bacterium]